MVLFLFPKEGANRSLWGALLKRGPGHVPLSHMGFIAVSLRCSCFNALVGAKDGV